MLPVGSMQGMFGILHAWFPALKVVLIGAVIALICIDHMDWMPQPPSHWFPLVPIGYIVTCFECKFIQLWIQWITIPNHCILYSYQYHSYLEDIAPLRFGSGQKKTLCVSGKISDGWSKTSESGVDLNGRASLGLWIRESSVLAMSRRSTDLSLVIEQLPTTISGMKTLVRLGGYQVVTIVKPSNGFDGTLALLPWPTGRDH